MTPILDLPVHATSPRILYYWRVSDLARGAGFLFYTQPYPLISMEGQEN